VEDHEGYDEADQDQEQEEHPECQQDELVPAKSLRRHDRGSLARDRFSSLIGPLRAIPSALSARLSGRWVPTSGRHVRRHASMVSSQVEVRTWSGSQRQAHWSRLRQGRAGQCDTLRMSMLVGLALATIVWLVLWAAYFLVAALIDEDVNHWDWPHEDGPGFAAYMRMLGVSGVAAFASAAIPTALILWLA
jgi:hypothetical protein